MSQQQKIKRRATQCCEGCNSEVFQRHLAGHFITQKRFMHKMQLSCARSFKQTTQQSLSLKYSLAAISAILKQTKNFYAVPNYDDLKDMPQTSAHSHSDGSEIKFLYLHRLFVFTKIAIILQCRFCTMVESQTISKVA